MRPDSTRNQRRHAQGQMHEVPQEIVQEPRMREPALHEADSSRHSKRDNGNRTHEDDETRLRPMNARDQPTCNGEPHRRLQEAQDDEQCPPPGPPVSPSWIDFEKPMALKMKHGLTDERVAELHDEVARGCRDDGSRERPPLLAHCSNEPVGQSREGLPPEPGARLPFLESLQKVAEDGASAGTVSEARETPHGNSRRV